MVRGSTIFVFVKTNPDIYVSIFMLPDSNITITIFNFNFLNTIDYPLPLPVPTPNGNLTA
jgi:hypothetical protein